MNNLFREKALAFFEDMAKLCQQHHVHISNSEFEIWLPGDEEPTSLFWHCGWEFNLGGRESRIANHRTGEEIRYKDPICGLSL